MATIHSLGQYFTTNLELKKKLVEMIKNEPDVILEPSIGRGDLIISVKEKFPQSSIDMYENHTERTDGSVLKQLSDNPYKLNVLTGL